MRRIDQPPTREELRYLNGWPKGTAGHDKDNALLDKLLALCNEHGFGCVHQMIGWIEDIWRHPEKVENEYRRMHAERMEQMAETIKYYQGQNRGPNLQNVPTTTEDGRGVKEAFNPKMPDTDYSETEQRIIEQMKERGEIE